MKKVLLLALNARWTHSNLAVFYLRNEIVKHNKNVEILQLNINNEFSDILYQIYKRKPDVLAISVYIWNSNSVKKLIGEIKKILPKLILLLGGPEVSYNPDFWLKKFPSIDAIVIGNGEEAFYQLAKNDFQVQNKIIFKPSKPFDTIDFPYNKNDFERLKNKYIYYESSRGCPFRCSYCLSAREDNGLQFRSLDKVFQEIEFICSSQPKIIKFVDRTFNANSKHSQAIWRFLLKKDYDTKFHFEIHPALLSENDFELLSKVKKGYFQFEIGIQSLNSKTLNAIRRGDNWQKAKENIARLMEMKNIHIHLDLIVGLPYESYEIFKRSFNGVYKLKPDMLQIGFLKVLPGSPIEMEREKYGIESLDLAPYTVLSTNDINFREIYKLQSFEKTFDFLYNSHIFETILDNLENNFSSAFDMYETLSDYFSSYEKISVTNIFSILYHFIGQEDNAEYLKDCIRYDWARYSKAHYYPDYMKSDKLSKAKKVGYAYLWEKNKISKQKLKRAVFFVANTSAFRNKYQKNKLITVFFNQTKEKINLPVEELE